MSCPDCEITFEMIDGKIYVTDCAHEGIFRHMSLDDAISLLDSLRWEKKDHV